jgi:hypothetical protein
VNLGNAIQNDQFAAALNTKGSGLVLGTSAGTGPAFGYPVPAS